jgi:hypothetical protein
MGKSSLLGDMGDYDYSSLSLYRLLLGGYYELHKPLLSIMAVFKVHNHNAQKYQIPIFHV